MYLDYAKQFIDWPIEMCFFFLSYLFDTLSSECTFSTGCDGCWCFGFSMLLLRPVVFSTFVASGCTATGATGFGSGAGCSFVDAGAGCCRFATIFVELSVCEAALPLFDCGATLGLCAGCFAFGLCFCCESKFNRKNNHFLLIYPNHSL